MQRPSTELIEKFNIIKQFKEFHLFFFIKDNYVVKILELY